MLVENKILSKLVDTGEFGELLKYNVSEADFTEQRETFLFIKNYYREYKEIPPYTTVVAECGNFEYSPEVADGLGYLCKKLKSDNAKLKVFNLLQKEAAEKFGEMSGSDFISWLHEQTSKIKETSNIDTLCGTNWAVNGAERKKLYTENKTLRTHQYIKTPYSDLTKSLGGGFELGDYVLLQAYTNRGKSWVATDIGVKSWVEGFGVLHYSPELSKKQQLQRLDTLHGKYKNSGLRSGELLDEDRYFGYLENFNEEQETPYMVKTMEDLPTGLNLDTIEADLAQNQNIKMVIIDGFILMRHGKGNRSNRDSMANTSRRLRQLFAKYGVVGVVVHQTPTSAEKENMTESEDGVRLPNPPELHQYSETVALIQDACTILNFDQVDGLGKIRLAKARTPNVGKEIDLHCDFDNGYITQASIIDEF